MSEPTNAVQLLRVELLLAEKRANDLRDQLRKAGDGDFVTNHDQDRTSDEPLDCL
jgi:hypothetical protein